MKMNLATISMIALMTALTVSCERSSRSIDIQPNANGVKPGTPDTGDGDKTGAAGSGSIELSLKGAASSASSLELNWSFKGKTGSKTVPLTSGSASVVIDSLPAGLGTLAITGKVDGTSIKDDSTDVEVEKNKTAKASLTVQIGTGGGTGGGGGGGTGGGGGGGGGGTGGGGGGGTGGGGGGGGTGGGGDGDVVIVPEIGPAKPPTNGSTAWDGKSFQGNAKWSLEPIP